MSNIPQHATQHAFDFDTLNEQPVEDLPLSVSPVLPQKEQKPRKVFFCYTLASSLDGKVFYVGKGNRTSRMRVHEREARKGVQSHKCRKIRKIWHAGGTIIKTKVAEFENEQDALIYEWCLINLIYKRENLTNASDGGEGPSGAIRDAQFRNHLSEIFKGREFTPEWRKRISEANTGRKFSIEARKNMAAAQKGKKQSPETIEKRRIAMKGRKPSPQTIEASRIARKGKGLSEEHKKKMSENGKRPENVERITKIALRNSQDLNVRAKISATLSTPEKQQKVREQFAGKEKTPEHRARLQSASSKLWHGFISPDGTRFESVFNLKDFCAKHNLNHGAMCQVGLGKMRSYKGWTRIEP